MIASTISSVAHSSKDEQRTSHLDAFVCPNCSRRCLWVHEPSATPPPRCLCGAELEAAPLPLGVYEIVAAPTPQDRTEGPVPPPDEPASDIRQEADVGYGASHGYTTGHGGPTGPGDAPARGDKGSKAD
jgi:hypothetical protein